jgi:general secretion pathway protein G
MIFLSRNRGFTLIELMMVLTVISILVSIAIPIANSAIIRSKEAVLRSNLYTLRTLIDQYTADKLKAPQSLDDIVAAGYLRSLPKDPITDRNDTWQIVMEDASLFPEQTETGIFEFTVARQLLLQKGRPIVSGRSSYGDRLQIAARTRLLPKRATASVRTHF